MLKWFVVLVSFYVGVTSALDGDLNEAAAWIHVLIWVGVAYVTEEQVLAQKDLIQGLYKHIALLQKTTQLKEVESK